MSQNKYCILFVAHSASEVKAHLPVINKIKFENRVVLISLDPIGKGNVNDFILDCNIKFTVKDLSDFGFSWERIFNFYMPNHVVFGNDDNDISIIGIEKAKEKGIKTSVIQEGIKYLNFDSYTIHISQYDKVFKRIFLVSVFYIKNKAYKYLLKQIGIKLLNVGVFRKPSYANGIADIYFLDSQEFAEQIKKRNKTESGENANYYGSGLTIYERILKIEKSPSYNFQNAVFFSQTYYQYGKVSLDEYLDNLKKVEHIVNENGIDFYIRPHFNHESSDIYKKNNFRLIENNESNIDTIVNNDLIISVSSTSLVEARILGKASISLPFLGNFSEAEISSVSLSLSNYGVKIAQSLNDFSNVISDKRITFEPFDYSEFPSNYIKKIILESVQ